MKFLLLAILGCAFAATCVEGVEHGKYFVCYFTNWSQYRPGIGKYNAAAHVDPYLCTHIVYSFIEIKNLEPTLREWNGDKLIGDLIALKQSNADLKVTVAVGGWNFGTKPFTEICSSEYNMQMFAYNAVEFMREWGFDGLDVDWEYPGSRGSPPEDKQRFTILLKILKNTFEEEAYNTGNPRLLLTAAVPGGIPTIDAGYEIYEVCDTLDLVHLMSYDLHGAWENRTDHHSALFSGSVDYGSSPIREFYVNDALIHYLEGGCSSKKIVLGIPLYGRGSKLSDSSKTGYGAPTSEPCDKGEYTREAGILAYYEICMTAEVASVNVDENALAPNLVYNNEWIGYEDEDSVRGKVAYLQAMDLAGAMIWCLDYDDFQGICPTNKKNVLSRAIKEELYLDEYYDDNPCYPLATTTAVTWWPPAQPPTSKPIEYSCFYDDSTCDCGDAVSTQLPPTVPGVGSTIKYTTVTHAPCDEPDCGATCSGGEGFYSHPERCDCFYQCANRIQEPIVRCCEPGLYFNSDAMACDYSSNVECTTASTGTSTTATEVSTTTTVSTSPNTADPVDTTDPTTETTTTNTIGFTCEGKADGNYPDPDDKTIFHTCSGGTDTVTSCPPGTYFNGSICDWYTS